MRGTWNLTARGLGSLARTVGRTRELEPAHRRDGLALGLIALAIVAAVGVWWRAAGPIGGAVEVAARTVLGAGAVTLPLVLIVVAVALMRSEPRPETRPRMVIGTLLVVLSVLGMLHIFTALPETNDARMYAGGALGAFSGGLLTKGVTMWVAVPLLILALIFGVLVFTATPVREIPHRLRTWGLDEEELADYEAAHGEAAAEPDEITETDPKPVRLRKPARRRQAGADSSDGAEQLDLDAALAEPPQPIRPPKPAAKPAEVPEKKPKKEPEPALTVTRTVEGDYQLPPPDLLQLGDAPKSRSKANDAMIEAITGVLEQFSIDARSPGSPGAPRSPATRSSWAPA